MSEDIIYEEEDEFIGEIDESIDKCDVCIYCMDCPCNYSFNNSACLTIRKRMTDKFIESVKMLKKILDGDFTNGMHPTNTKYKKISENNDCTWEPMCKIVEPSKE